MAFVKNIELIKWLVLRNDPEYRKFVDKLIHKNFMIKHGDRYVFDADKAKVTDVLKECQNKWELYRPIYYKEQNPNLPIYNTKPAKFVEQTAEKLTIEVDLRFKTSQVKAGIAKILADAYEKLNRSIVLQGRNRRLSILRFESRAYELDHDKNLTKEQVIQVLCAEFPGKIKQISEDNMTYERSLKDCLKRYSKFFPVKSPSSPYSKISHLTSSLLTDKKPKKRRAKKKRVEKIKRNTFMDELKRL